MSANLSNRWLRLLLALALVGAVALFSYVGLSTPRKLTLSVAAKSEQVAVTLADCGAPQAFVLPPGRFILVDAMVAEDGSDLPALEVKSPTLVSARGNAQIVFDQSDRTRFRVRAASPASETEATPAFTLRTEGAGPAVETIGFAYEAATEPRRDGRSPPFAALILHYPFVGEYVIGKVPARITPDSELTIAESTPSLLSATIKGHDLARVSNSRIEILSEQAGPGDEILTDPEERTKFSCDESASGVISVEPRGEGTIDGRMSIRFDVIAHANRTEFLIHRGGDAHIPVGVSWLEAISQQTALQFFWAVLMVLLLVLSTCREWFGRKEEKTAEGGDGGKKGAAS